MMLNIKSRLPKPLLRGITCFCLVGLLTLSACSSQPPSRFEQAQQESVAVGSKNNAVDKKAIEGAKFNEFFPTGNEQYERVFTQEKDGFVQAKLKFEGQDLATLAIFDTISNPSAKDEFVGVAENIQGFPVIAKGSTNTAVLVADRYQVTVRSSDPSFDLAQRKEWLNKFDLKKLATLN